MVQEHLGNSEVPDGWITQKFDGVRIGELAEIRSQRDYI